jgi:hypothetical protein
MTGEIDLGNTGTSEIERSADGDVILRNIGELNDGIQVATASRGLQTAIDALPSGGGRVFVIGDVPISTTISVPSNVSIHGTNPNADRIYNDGVSAGNYMLESADADYIQVAGVKIDGADQSVSGLHHPAPSSQPTHHLTDWIHVVNCDVGIYFNHIEDCWIQGGRIGNCNTGIKFDVPAGFGAIKDCHVVDCDTYSLDIDARAIDLTDVVCGSSAVSHHINVRSDTEQIGMRSCWFETLPPVMDTGTNTLEHLDIKGATRILLGNSNNAFIGDYNHANIQSLAFTDNDGTTVDLFGSNPDRVTGGNVKLIGSAEWTKKGFAYLYGPSQTVTDRVAVNPTLQQRRAGVNESISAGATQVTVDFPGSEPDTSYGVLIEPQWDTTHFVAGKATGTFDATFGTAPASDSAFDYWIYRTI